MKAVLWVSLLLCTGTYVCGPIVDPDLGWHITVGRWILAHGEIPTVDHWNLFAHGTPWRAYSWSSEVLLALTDRVGGTQGLISLKMLLGILLSASLFYCLAKIAGDWFFGALLGVFATCACFNHFTLRPQTLVWVFFISLVWFLEKVRREGLSMKPIIALMVVMALWANTHITTVLGLATVFLWLFDGDRKSFALALKASSLCFLATLFTPYFGGEWLTFLSKTGHPFAHRSIAEFQSATIMQFSTGFAVLILVLLLSFLHKQPRLLELPKLFLGAVFLIGGLAVVKFLPFSVIILCSLTAQILWRAKQENLDLGNIAEGVQRLRALTNRIPREGLSFVVLVLAFLNISHVWQEPIAEDVLPVRAVDFILDEKLPHPILNDFGHGGYMMYRLSDRSGVLNHRVPIDGRTNVVPPEVWEKFQAAYHGGVRWKEYLEIVKPNTILWRIESPLIPILFAEGDWCMIYGDPSAEAGFSVLVRKDFFLKEGSRFRSSNCSEQENAGIVKPG